eukprot:358823-Pelagomonas_calceolata.AAC.5
MPPKLCSSRRHVPGGELALLSSGQGMLMSANPCMPPNGSGLWLLTLHTAGLGLINKAAVPEPPSLPSHSSLSRLHSGFSTRRKGISKCYTVTHETQCAVWFLHLQLSAMVIWGHRQAC